MNKSHDQQIEARVDSGKVMDNIHDWGIEHEKERKKERAFVKWS